MAKVRAGRGHILKPLRPPQMERIPAIYTPIVTPPPPFLMPHKQAMRNIRIANRRSRA